ncbi:MAG: DUF3800 domain-containing protein [Methanomassiliicoccaceae archaeon]|nr:DUF3800 domain-containing protein [Methanomassiliicoccaceae archaeon]
MYLTYIDESGKPERTDSENEFVLAALIINEREWKNVDNKVKDIKKKYFPGRDPESFEIHATDIINKKSTFKSMHLNTRLELMTDILKVISEIDCRIVSVIIRKDMLYNPEFDVEMNAMKYLFERLCYFHNKANEAEELEEYGLMLIDSVNPKYDNKMRARIKEWNLRGSEYNKSDYMIEDPIFVDSKYRHLSQLVDCIAYCVRKRYRSKTTDFKEKRTYEGFYNIIEEKFLRKYSEIDGYGVKIFPKCCGGERPSGHNPPTE